ncbi:tetratricopeptide repeat protein [Gemmatimonas sp.]|jgi:tetratricopeptide (TPR) repeat protein|uniref:tetratricopeptide repeat protein n=1 Tax=Gemmatimonas sp. TaxID=1962908 RepID=UPI0037C06FEC
MSTAARIDELRKKFEDNPRRFFAPLANELRKAGNRSQAIALCREYLPKQPGHMSGYIVFGQTLYESGELDAARRIFEQALVLDPENLIALHHLGHIARQQGDPAAARRWYERGLETDPRNDDIAHQLASVNIAASASGTAPAPVAAIAPLRTEPSAQAAVDDPFAFADAPLGHPEGASDAAVEDLDAQFVAGLTAESWPDTAPLMQRVPTARGARPVSIALPAEAVEAFGREPLDRVGLPLPAPEPGVRGPEAAPDAPATTASVDAAAGGGTLGDQTAATSKLSVAAVPMVSAAASAAASAPPALSPDLQPEVQPEGLLPDIDPPPAFVTETMGELLVAQGFTDRAVVVYEELVRRRPNDPLLSARLAALRETQAPPASTMPPTYTARERFTALAARRVSRRTPPYAVPLAAPGAPPVSVAAATSLAALFGGDAPPRDDTAARALAQAFAPNQVDRAAGPESLPVTFFGRERREPSAADAGGRQPSPVRGSVPMPMAAPAGAFSFDRYFPEPSAPTAASGRHAPPARTLPAETTSAGTTQPSPPPPRAADDLAQFSDWLKGLGNS